MSIPSDSDLLYLQSDTENEAIIMECIENNGLERSQIVTNMIGQIDLKKCESNQVGSQRNKKMMVNNIDNQQYVRGQSMKENNAEIMINIQSKEVYRHQDTYDEANAGIYLGEIKESCLIEGRNDKNSESKDMKQFKINEKPRTIKVTMLSEVKKYVGKIIFNRGNKYEVSFYVQHGKNDSTIFRKPKKVDIDTIQMIVKPVQLKALNPQESDFAFFEDDDLVYFDCQLENIELNYIYKYLLLIGLIFFVIFYKYYTLTYQIFDDNLQHLCQ